MKSSPVHVAHAVNETGSSRSMKRITSGTEPLRSASSFVLGRPAVLAPVAAILTLVTSACTPAPPPNVARPQAEPVGTPKAIVPPEGVALESTCVSTGPELCFDGIDNNCNGLLEEGCGIRSGDLQFVAAWSEPEADVDLLVTDPTGEVAKLEGGPTAGGLQKDRECPGSDRRCRGQNLENVILAEGIEPKAGIYRVVLRLDSTHGATLPIKVRVGARMGAKVYGLTVELTKPEEEKTITFRLLRSLQKKIVPMSNRGRDGTKSVYGPLHPVRSRRRGGKSCSLQRRARDRAAR